MQHFSVSLSFDPFNICPNVVSIDQNACTSTVLLGAASQRIEYLALEFIGTYGGVPWMLDILHDWKTHERGSIPGPTECCIMLFIISLIWGEMNSLYSSGIVDYVSDLWNVIDFISNSFYATWIGLRITSWGLAQVSWFRVHLAFVQ